jgi:hydrogenase maturation factor
MTPHAETTASRGSARPGGSYVDAELSADLASAALDLARRFHDGATLWVISPQWEPHAHHVAVEFVHPVVMGKRALPSVALVDPDPVAAARVASQPGDLLIAVASADEPAVIDAMRRAQAWGVLTLWIGSGSRPPAGAANHILWIDSDDPMVPATGAFVLLYHLLWELTHVCFEHSGLLKPETDGGSEDVCVTCSDEGRIGEVLLEPAGATDPALVRTAVGEEWVDVTMVGDVARNDLVLVHAGAAISRLGRDERLREEQTTDERLREEQTTEHEVGR